MADKFFEQFKTAKDSIFNTGVGVQKKIANPFIGGYSFIKFDTGRLLADEIGLDPNFFELMERTIKEVSGFPKIELNVGTITGGFTNNEHVYPTEISKNLTELTLKFQEFSGTPFTKQFRKWVTAIRNPETGLYSLSNYGLPYYSVSMLYVVTSPGIGSHYADARKDAVEFAALATAMYPKSIDLDKYNYNTGDHPLNELDQNFGCNFHIGEEIMQRAQDYVASDEFYDKLSKATQNIYDGSEIDFFVNKDKTTELSNISGSVPTDTTALTPVIPEF